MIFMGYLFAGDNGSEDKIITYSYPQQWYNTCLL